jgi:hypothetical protein
MATPAHDEFSQFPVEAIARLLAACGNEDPTLLRRSRVPPAAAALERIHMRLPPPLRSSSPSEAHTGDCSDQRGYLEELVSIAVASARRAEDAARQVRAASAAAPRRMFAVTTFGAIAILIGIVGITGAQFGLDLPRLLADASSEFAAVDRLQPAELHALVGVQPPPVAATTADPPAQVSGEPRRDGAILPPASVAASTTLESESRAQLPTPESVSTIQAPPVPQPPQAAAQAEPIMQAAVLPSADSQTGGWRRTRPDRRRGFVVLADIIRGPALVLSRLGLHGAIRSTSSHSASGVLEPK